MSMATAIFVIKPFSPLIRQCRKPRLNHHHAAHTPLSLNRVLTHLPASLTSVAAPSAAKSPVDEFDPELPIEEASTPPSSWYTDPFFLRPRTRSRLLSRLAGRWLNSHRTSSLAGSEERQLGNVEFVVCRDDNGKIHAFHNVCRHHASLLASGSGRKSCSVCPYHGWTYALNGALLRATRIKGIRNFDVKEFGLIPLKVATWGPFVLLNFEKDVSPDQEVESDIAAKEWTGSCVDILGNNCINPSLTYLCTCRREYTLECNWKVFCDNYLDGGYHVPYAHKGLASGLKLDSYSTTIHEKVSLQICEGGSTDSANDFDLLGAKALYAFIYPNFMINRYGPWMDTNPVLPLGPRKCCVIFDYFPKDSLKDDKLFVERSLQDSERVEMEDIVLCKGVQKGLEPPAYCGGRYAPTVENAMYHSMVCSIALSKGEFTGISCSVRVKNPVVLAFLLFISRL